MHKSEVPALPGSGPYGFRLFDRQTFKKPSEFLSCEGTYLGSGLRPLESSGTIDAFVQKAESIPVEIESLDRITSFSAKEIQGMCIWVHLIGIPDDRHQSIYAASHIRRAGHAEDFGDPRDIT